MSDAREARGDDLSRRELERQLQELKRDKVRLDDNIRKMEANQKRIFGEEGEKKESDSTSKITAAQEDEKKDEDEKEEKSDGEEVSTKKKEEDKKDDEDDESKKRKREEDQEKRKKEGRPTKSDPRSRNLFGKLLGHLHSAKSNLAKEKSSKSSELQQKALSRVEEKVNLSRMNIKEFRKGHFEQQMKEDQEKVAEINKEIAAKEVLLLQRVLESHYSNMMNYIRTKAQPTIFFLPAKHTKDTEKQLEETRSAIKNKIASLKVQLQQEDEEETDQRASAAAAAMAAAEGKKDDDADDDKNDDDDKEEKKDEDEPAKKKQKTDGSDSEDS